ncbi:hypothetical protein VTN31DRAFT_212 [Thermomyces dupontii]|uniref:uncharacterized protein n=1 Tax=Talaromyces thermophilus TaxID=28565 RepID=UPI0037428703
MSRNRAIDGARERIRQLKGSVSEAISNWHLQEKLGTKYMDSPYSFFNSEYRVTTGYGMFQRTITGTFGRRGRAVLPLPSPSTEWTWFQPRRQRAEP